jgi:MOSC domain-containing protein YiiM
VNDVIIQALLTGSPQSFGPNGEPSSMARTRRTQPQHLNFLGFDGDQVGDPTVHGGPDKAVHAYPFEHYEWWLNRIGMHDLLQFPGAFGENLTLEGMIEDEVCIGDQFRIGTALVEVSQGRQPCWKLNHRFGRSDIVASVVGSGRGGWYFRVLEQGVVTTGDALTLIDRPYAQWSVARTFGLLIAGGHRQDMFAVEALAHLDVLADSWRARAVQLLR